MSVKYRGNHHKSLERKFTSSEVNAAICFKMQALLQCFFSNFHNLVTIQTFLITVITKILQNLGGTSLIYEVMEHLSSLCIQVKHTWKMLHFSLPATYPNSTHCPDI